MARSDDLLFNVVCSLLTHTSTPALSTAHALLFVVHNDPLSCAAHILACIVRRGGVYVSGEFVCVC